MTDIEAIRMLLATTAAFVDILSRRGRLYCTGKDGESKGGGAIASANLRIRGRSERHYSLFTKTMLIEAGFNVIGVGASPTLRIICCIIQIAALSHAKRAPNVLQW